MGPDPERLNEQVAKKVVELKNVTATFYEVTDQRGEKQVGVLLQRTDKGQSREFRIDLCRLEMVVDRGNDIQARLVREAERVRKDFGSKAPERTLELGSWTASYHLRQDPAGKLQVVVYLDETVTGRQFSCDLPRLGQVAKWGMLFEHERGHERNWYPVVRIESLAEEGWVRAEVVRWAEREVARKYADENRNHGFGLCEKPFRRLFDFPLTLKESEIPSLAAEIRFLKAELVRRAPGLLLGIWYQQGQTPYQGMPVTILGGRDPTSREPADYRVIPAGVQTPQGPNDIPITILVHLDTKNQPPIHCIAEVVYEGELAGRAKLQERKIEQQRHEEAMDLSRANLPQIPWH